MEHATEETSDTDGSSSDDNGKPRRKGGLDPQSEHEWRNVLRRALSNCHTCGEGTLCKIDKAGKHVIIDAIMLSFWAKALVRIVLSYLANLSADAVVVHVPKQRHSEHSTEN